VIEKIADKQASWVHGGCCGIALGKAEGMAAIRAIMLVQGFLVRIHKEEFIVFVWG